MPENPYLSENLRRLRDRNRQVPPSYTPPSLPTPSPVPPPPPAFDPNQNTGVPDTGQVQPFGQPTAPGQIPTDLLDVLIQFNPALRDRPGGPFGAGGIQDQFNPLLFPAGGFAQTAMFKLLAEQANQQGGRSQGVEQGLLDLINQSFGSQASALNQDVLAGGRNLADPAALQALRQGQREDVFATAAETENAATNRLRDMGAFSGGNVGADPAAAIANLAGRQRQQGLLDVEDRFQNQQRSNLLGANQLSATGTDIFRALQEEPVLRYLQRLDSAQNPGLAPLVEALSQFGQLREGVALANPGRSTFERAAPLIGGGLGAIGSIGGILAGGALSDRRAKTDIRPTGRYVNGTIPVVRFRYVGGEAEHIGVIAQDVERVVPSAVTERGGLKYVLYDMLEDIHAHA